MNSLNNTVIKNDFCIGCGVCTIGKNTEYRITLTKYGMYRATRISNINSMDNENLCLFSDQSKNEDELSKILFDYSTGNYDHVLGYYKSSYFGYDVSNQDREASSSGGLLTWLNKRLLENGDVNAVVHPKYSPEGEAYYKYQVSETLEELQTSRKSYYYPVELSEVLKVIENDKSNKVYAVVAVPCFITNLRLLCEQNDFFKKKIKYLIGINCGHLKSTHFGDYFAWQNNISPKKLIKVDFRAKLKDKPAGDYAFNFNYLDNGKEKSLLTKPSNQHFGYNWGLGFFKYKACDFCDDVFAETADIIFGDAWIKPYVNDWRGTNVVVVRDEYLDKILTSGADSGEIKLIEASPKEVKGTQAATIRHRREGLSIRLWMVKTGWKPKKRVLAEPPKTKKLKKIHSLRIKLRKRSHKAFLIARQLRCIWIFNLLTYPLTVKYFFIYGVYSKAIPSFILKPYRKILYIVLGR